MIRFLHCDLKRRSKIIQAFEAVNFSKLISRKILVCKVFFDFHTLEHESQCGNLGMLLPLRIYVKSTLANS